ncbi:MAG: glycosyltransferase family 2 protein [Paludisphaera borealis]|uniref:glycosyltransferase family 2 protein n=1 Tax=Paludisphaera borealis TaxID=1387353 RepID=UPI00283F322D|nr:glycosyltransferase family 2 protein [Paludisphaera borealis]MDR3620186.1 glycosyltransferase family 2 protein [Paludisphaera borealis]
MPEPKITALIVARNEERKLPGCLDSVRFAHERIVVVDAASDDDTLAVARRSAEIVIVRPFDDFASQRNAGLAAATGDWILSIDADERVTPGLAVEIQDVLTDSSDRHAGFRIPIRSEILGRPFGYSGTQQDLPMRLFRRGRGSWTGQVHETVDLDGSIGRMRHPLDHHTIPDVQVFLRKIDQYTTLEAHDLYRSGDRYRTRDLTLRPVWLFLKLYLYKQGFRDGLEGLMFCALSGVSAAVRTWKLRELDHLETAS